MELEQKRPQKPNFLLIVLLSAGAIVVILLIALAVVGFDGKRLLRFHSTHTELVLPSGEPPLVAKQLC